MQAGHSCKVRLQKKKIAVHNPDPRGQASSGVSSLPHLEEASTVSMRVLGAERELKDHRLN